MLRKKRIATLAATAIALLAWTSHASAAAGGYWPGSGYCTDSRNDGLGNRITASAPVMYPAETSGVIGGGQMVGFFVTLQRWDGNAWVASQFSVLKTQTASWGFNSEVWYDERSHTQVSGATAFPISYAGYYRLRYDYVWFDSNARVTGHTASLSYGLRDDRDRLSSLAITGWSYVDWCQY